MSSAIRPGRIGMSNREIAEAFSGHRFADAYAHLAPDVRWVLVGAEVLEGADAVRQACDGTTEALVGTTTTFLRSVTADGGDVVAVDVVGRYDAPDGTTSLVSSCDVYEFRAGAVATITSYTVELDALPAALAAGG
jgi:ketosteroid isomerase-like protein